MFKLLLGIILFLLPFLLVVKFKDRMKGFFCVFIFVIGFHLSLAIVTQSFGIFNYAVISSVNLLAAVIVIFVTDFEKVWKDVKKIRIDWVLVFVIFVLFFSFFQVHYNYSGKVTTIDNLYIESENMRYPYPYLSDEWISVSLINYSVSMGKLPMVNPLWHNSNFFNFELAFHSFSSEIILFFGLNPLIHYNFLSIFSSIIICFLVYFILKLNNVNSFVSGISAISVSYIVNGANLPGLWFFIPFNMGLICLLFSLVFLSFKDSRMFLFSSFLVLFFYPPLIIFSLASFFVYSFSRKDKLIYLYMLFFLFVLFLLLLFVFGNGDVIRFIFSKIFYIKFDLGTPMFSFWNIIPFFVIPFGLFGLFYFYNEKPWLTLPVVVGMVFWIIYSIVDWRFLIGFERLVIITSVLFVLISGFGLQRSFDFFKNRLNIKFDFVKLFQVFILILFLFFSFSYTEGNRWSKLTAKNIDTDKIYFPAAPANNYLIEDDLILFENISGKNFLAHPWKGLVVGIATGNYPLHTKESIISVRKFDYFDFLEKSCNDKSVVVKNFDIDYIYSESFDCDGFRLIGKSREGFSLYEVSSNLYK